MPNEGNVPGAPSQEPDSFWPFRMGLPGPLPPPPVLFKAYGHQYPDDWDDICQRSRALCIQCGLTVRGTVDLVWRTNKYLPGSVPEATLLVNSPWDAEATEKWSLASERVYAFLTSKDLSSIHVEINDLDKTENMYSFPALGANAPITEVWERGDDPLERRVLNSIKGLAWSTLSVLGNDEDPHRPTILLRVWNPRHLVWKEKTSEIRALCSHHLTAVVDVAILQAYEVRFGAGHVREPREFTELCFGASIEAKDQSLGAGTLGGFFELEQKGARRVQIALTCYHVIRALNLRSGVDDTGFTAETSRQYNVETISPAQVDTDATLEAWRTVVAQQEERIRSFEKVLFLDPDNVRYEQAKERATRTLTNASDKVSQIQSANVCVGPVIATGGYRQDTEGWPLDWAIVETGNRRPRTRNEAVDNSTGELMGGILRIPSSLSIKPGTDLFKAGRSTGLTSGTVSSLRANIRFPDQPDKVFKAWEIPKAKGRGDWACYGDSGSLCFDSKDNWCGLVFGGDINSGAGFVIPADVIVRDVKNMTGGDLLLI